MAKSWETNSVERGTVGVFKVFVRAPGDTGRTDITYFRGAPIQLGEYSNADPFGDATFTMTFSTITPFDDIATGDLNWLREWSSVDIYLKNGSSRRKVWEGHIASIDISNDDTSYTTEVQCQGALFQLDSYVQLTEYLNARVPIEDLIKQAFNKSRRPHLRTTNLHVRFPEGWKTKDKQGNKITGFYSRDTGTNGQRPLTGWIQTSLLPLMQTSDQGFTQRWTILHDFGRHPYLTPRDVTTANWTIDCSSAGVYVRTTRDGTQNANVMFGDGTDTAGNEWHRFRISPRGTRTEYEPLAYDPRAYPISKTNKNLDKSIFRVENYTGYGSGFDESDAITDAQKVLNREKNAGWTGTITLKIDPYEDSRYFIRAGQNIKVKYFAGSGAAGTFFHIAQVSVNADTGEVTLTVDTKGRDLLTLEQIISRNRDSHTPSRLLRVGAQSTFFKDIYAPWSYPAGCGFVAPFNESPDARKLFLQKAGKNDSFPWDDLLKRFPPRKHPEFYLTIRAQASDSRKRWTKGQILVNHSGQIRQVEFAMVDAEGNQKAIPFHVSFYSISGIDYPSMPRGTDPNTGKFEVSPFLPGAFVKDEGDPNFDKFKVPDESFIIGWGDGDQKAGFWPGLESNNRTATGRLVDEGTWSYDLTQDVTSNEQLKSLRTIYVMAYAESSNTYPVAEPVYLIGRIYNAPKQGSDG